MTMLRLLVGRLRQDRLPGVLLVVLVLFTASLAAAAPRAFTRTADAGLRHEVREASVIERNLQLGRITRVGSPADRAMTPVDEVAGEVRAALPPGVLDVISGDSVVAKSIVYSVVGRDPARPGYVTLHFQDRIDDEVRLAEGRMPTGATTRAPAPDLPPASVPIPEDRVALVFEAAISTRAAEELGASVGDRLDLIPDRDDTLVGDAGWQPEAAAVDIVGLYEVVDPAGDVWVGDRSLHEPTLIPVGINVVLIYASALLSPDAYPAVLELSYPMRYAFRFTVDPERFDAGRLDPLATELRRMEASYASFATQDDPTRTTLQTGLLDLLDAFRAERRTTEAVLTTAALGPAAVATAAAAVLALLAMRRRRTALTLVRARGGSALQLIGSHVLEGLLLTASPAALGAWLAVTLVESGPTPLAWVAAASVAVATTIVLVAAATPTALRSLRELGREGPAPIGAGARRLAFEGLAIGLAIGGVFLLRERGLAGGSAAGELAGVDPLLAAVPALIGLAVGIVTVRVAPYPIRVAGWLAASGRGLVTALGLRRAERQAGTGQLPLVVVLLTVAIGTFSSTMLATIDRGQVVESWQSVGAAFRISADAGRLEELDLTGLPAVAAVAGAHEVDASIGLSGGGRARLIAIDAPEYGEVTAGTPAETTWPDAFTDAGEVDGERPGTTDNSIPAIVSRGLARSSTASFRVGDTFELSFAARFATFRVVELRDTVPTRSAGDAFVVVPRERLRAALVDRQLPSTSLFVRASDGAASELRELIGDTQGAVTLDARAERLAALRARPLVGAVVVGFLAALAVSVAYAALAVIVSMLLSGSARARETAHLRTMGIGRGQVTWMTVVEHAPPVLVAMAAGLGLGVAVAWVVLPGLGLSAFTGSAADPVLTVDARNLVLLAVALLAIVATGVLLAAWSQRRADPATAVREGIE
jgi:putative ABC transport system permease protein